MIKQGIEILKKDNFKILKGKRVALLAHAASVDINYTHILELLLKNNINIKVIFGPEHGVKGAAQDMEGVDDEKEIVKTVTLYDGTYESLFPKIEDLKGIDTILIDLQDVGSRYYTYIYTASFFLEKAKELSIEVIILDRVNPIGGTQIEGNLVESGFESFVGYYPYFLNRHSLTIGEMLNVINDKIGADLKVIHIENYKREDSPDSLVNWILPSPNMPTFETALLYPGGCLIEGTTLSEGRGTTKPFHFIGAPYINSSKLKMILDSHNLEGIKFRDISFKPMFQKYANEICNGVELHITDKFDFLPLKTYLTLIYEIYHNFKEFDFRRKEYEFVEKPIAMDLLFGTDKVRKAIENGEKLENIYKMLTPPKEGLEIINKFKIY